MSHPDLPRGQRAIDFFPRFGVPFFADRWPTVPERPGITIRGLVEKPVTSELAALGILPRHEIVADFHCVTTWTRAGVRWGGYRLEDVLNTLVPPRARPRQARYLRFVSLDGYEVCIDWRDVDADTLLADQLNGQPLSLEHGAPLRLVAPALYGYKNAKHVNRIEFLADYRRGRAERQTLAHPRARVAYEERGRILPSWIYRHAYRALIPLALASYARAARVAEHPS
ncbi:molybdopterin-dependent oxidoreductase [Bradyrhizobium sp.]|uniref:molybdopterin-dependent oxidoreductase n=1 Tax=Bradyrhizobium sp. TaxID=376 RepID=UPI0025BF9D17|nr:molybdopterin-dependent oxidoreductase [Bradyrhizobium sp.]